MENYLGVLSSDTLNRDGYVIAFEALLQMTADNATKGMPSLVDHDFHRPIGWIFPFGLLIEPKISKTIGNFLVCDDENDMNLLRPKINHYWTHINYKNCQQYLDEFKAVLNESYLSEGRFIDKGCVAFNYPSITKIFFPSLFDNTDKSGLIYLDDILSEFDYVGSGIFKSKNNKFSIFCHQYFNRNLSLINNYNTYFIDEFVKLNSNRDIKLRIAIDENLIGLSKSYKGVLEFDYWWGPKFNDDISNLPNEVTRYECNEEQKFFSSVLGTEFWWKSDKNEKTLEIEEIREKPSLGVGDDSYGCRYIHSIYNNDKQEFVHFDGAVRLYSEEQILERWGVNINKAGKDTNYKKLFRIDGKLELTEWKKLCILYYKGNPLLFEYFGAKEEYEAVRNSAKPQDVLSKYVPYKISPEDGVRLFVTYHEKEVDYAPFQRKVINPDIIHFENGEVISVLEYDIVEIKKLLQRDNEDLEFPPNIKFVKPFDFSTNYPIIIHGEEDTQILIQNTLKAYKTIFAIQNKNMNKTITFTIGWQMQDFEVRLSIFGKSSELLNWLNKINNVPVDYESFKKWLVQQKEWIYSNYSSSKNDYLSLLRDDGIFYIKRKSIDRKMISLPNSVSEGYSINTNGNQELDNFLEDGSLHPSYLGLITKSSCSVTGEDYLTSKTSKYLDDNVKMHIENLQVLGFFWTDSKYD